MRLHIRGSLGRIWLEFPITHILSAAPGHARLGAVFYFNKDSQAVLAFITEDVDTPASLAASAAVLPYDCKFTDLEFCRALPIKSAPALVIVARLAANQARSP